MKVKLNVGDRVTLLRIIPFPKEGGRLAFKLVNDFIEELSFSPKDFKDFKLVEKDRQVSWKSSKDKEIEVEDVILEIIKNTLKQLDKEEKLDRYSYLLYERFITNLKM